MNLINYPKLVREYLSNGGSGSSLDIITMWLSVVEPEASLNAFLLSLLESPIYEHDCKACMFIGFVELNGSNFDLYYCPAKREYIARYGNEGNYIAHDADSIEKMPRDYAPSIAWQIHTDQL